MPTRQLPILSDNSLVLITTPNKSIDVKIYLAMHRVTTYIVFCSLLAASVASAAGPPVSLIWKAGGIPYAPVALSSGQTLTLSWNVGPHTVYEV